MITRRNLLRGVAGTLGLLGSPPRHASAEPPPETTRLRLAHFPSICVAPQYILGDLLKAEGFGDIQYVKLPVTDLSKALASGTVDISLQFVVPLIMQLDAGDPITLLGGVHVGCYELFGTDRVRSIRDLQGKTIAVPGLESSQYVYLASMLAYVGLTPQKDVNWVTHPMAEAIQLFAEEKIDAIMLPPPLSQELRTKQIGHVVVNTTVDRPWSQYFCCMVAGNQEFVRKHPVATKRALRAILKAADVCALEPDRVARLLVDRDYVKRYDYALLTMQELPYGQWREYDPEDTIRFFALRLHEAGMIQSSPQKIIAQGTDWRFFNALKKELKG